MSGAELRGPADLPDWARAVGLDLCFAGPDPHYGIGLEALLPAYRIACVEATPAVAILRAAGLPVLALEDSNPAPPRPAVEPSTEALLADPRAAAFIGPGPGRRLLVFKTSHRIETLCAARGWELLAAPARLSRRWENKLVFRDLAEQLGLRQPPGRVVDLAETAYPELARELGPHFVLQAAHGYSGARTYAVRGEADFRAAAEALRQRSVRATAFIAGLPLTLSACLTARGVATGAPCRQVTGLPALTRYPLGSCGNDWPAAEALGLDPAPFVDVARVVGGALAGEGYRGLFGLDFVLAEDGGLFLIELNPRLVASVALQTQLELIAGRLPLLARHLAAFVDPEADRAPLDLHLGPLEGGQVILHNLAPAARRLGATPGTGVYGWDAGADQALFRRPGVRVDDLAAPGEVLVLAPAPGRPVSGGHAWSRLQTRGSVMDADGGLRPEIARMVEWMDGAAGWEGVV